MEKYLLEKAKEIAIGVALDKMDDIREFLALEAAKTDNKLDDMMVDTICDWATEFLEDLGAKL